MQKIEYRSSWARQGEMGTESEGLGTRIFGSKHRIEAFSLLMSEVFYREKKKTSLLFFFCLFMGGSGGNNIFDKSVCCDVI